MVVQAERGGVPDLDDPAQIAAMVRHFYRSVAQDDLLGPVFNDVARVDWPEHLDKLTAFWCRTLLSRPGYEGNPLRAHALIDARHRFTAAHFARWLELFDETLADGWAGPRVEQASEFARRVAIAHARWLGVSDGQASDTVETDQRVGATRGPT